MCVCGGGKKQETLDGDPLLHDHGTLLFTLVTRTRDSTRRKSTRSPKARAFVVVREM